jgi:hypothetical protein
MNGCKDGKVRVKKSRDVSSNESDNYMFINGSFIEIDGNEIK